LPVIAFDCLLQPWHTAQYKTSGCVHLDILKPVFVCQNMEQTLFISTDMKTATITAKQTASVQSNPETYLDLWSTIVGICIKL